MGFLQHLQLIEYVCRRKRSQKNAGIPTKIGTSSAIKYYIKKRRIHRNSKTETRSIRNSKKESKLTSEALLRNHPPDPTKSIVVTTPRLGNSRLALDLQSRVYQYLIQKLV